MQIDVLDHGFVRVIEVLGNDSLICEAARNSYGKGTKSISDDTTLIRYLMRHAQREIREYANVIGYNIVANYLPITWKAFLDYEIHAIKFSRHELTTLYAMCHGHLDFDIFKQRTASWNKREAAEFLTKLDQF